MKHLRGTACRLSLFKGEGGVKVASWLSWLSLTSILSLPKGEAD